MAAPQPFSLPTDCYWSNELTVLNGEGGLAHVFGQLSCRCPTFAMHVRWVDGSAAVGHRALSLGLRNFFDESTLGSREVTSFMRASADDHRCDIIACGYIADMCVRLRWNWILVCASFYIRSILSHVMIKHLRPTLGEHRRWSQNGHKTGATPQS